MSKGVLFDLFGDQFFRLVLWFCCMVSVFKFHEDIISPLAHPASNHGRNQVLLYCIIYGSQMDYKSV